MAPDPDSDQPPPPFFDPRNQTFFIAGPDGQPTIAIAMSTIDAQRVRLANTSINYGVQLGLCLLSLLVTLMLQPAVTPRLQLRRRRAPLPLVHVAALAVAVVRLALLVVYFPGPLAEYYVAWTDDAGVLRPEDYTVNTISNAFAALQFALIEVALVLQSWSMVHTWPRRWRAPTLCVSIMLAVGTVVVKSLWVVHHTSAIRGHTLPVPLDNVGKAAVILGAVSIFYFCGLFFAHLSLHLLLTRSILRRSDRGGLTSLEILAIGNGILMLAPSLFAGLDIAAGPGNTKVLPFDAGSWVQTLVVAGLPLIGLVAQYRASDSHSSSRLRLTFPLDDENHHPRDRSREEEDATLADFGSNTAASFVVAGGSGGGGRSPRSVATSFGKDRTDEDGDMVEMGARRRSETVEGEERGADCAGGGGGIQVRREYVITVEDMLK
ncbi:fungal pheromone mating factor STE2 GPCR-domain-containing protein [Xylariaceae sp. FL0662B]|nr:fungal pheromone mating factor STE2 GPCR-domain-containing protein [Xylariaceae sp. FL0662B]